MCTHWIEQHREPGRENLAGFSLKLTAYQTGERPPPRCRVCIVALQAPYPRFPLPAAEPELCGCPRTPALCHGLHTKPTAPRQALLVPPDSQGRWPTHREKGPVSGVQTAAPSLLLAPTLFLEGGTWAWQRWADFTRVSYLFILLLLLPLPSTKKRGLPHSSALKPYREQTT